MGITVLTIISRSKSLVSSLVRSRPFVRSRRVSSRCFFPPTSLSFVRSTAGRRHRASRVPSRVPFCFPRRAGGFVGSIGSVDRAGGRRWNRDGRETTGRVCLSERSVFFEIVSDG